MRRSSQGFTLIELVMVVVILGVLAAFALPRFANFSGDARVAAVQGMAGAMRSAASIVHAQWLISSGDLTVTSTQIDDATIALEDSYPSISPIAPDTTPGIIAAIGGTSSLGQFVLATPTARDEAAGTAGVLTLTLGNCVISYKEALDDNADDDISDLGESMTISIDDGDGDATDPLAC